jgi:hypothetical protein
MLAHIVQAASTIPVIWQDILKLNIKGNEIMVRW